MLRLDIGNSDLANKNKPQEEAKEERKQPKQLQREQLIIRISKEFCLLSVNDEDAEGRHRHLYRSMVRLVRFELQRANV